MTGKVAIITGSGSGIGAASAVLLAKNGWNIVINYASRIDSAKEVAQACEAHGAETLLCKANVAEDADCRRMAADAMTKWGRIDALVNSAGTTRFADHADLEALSGDDFLEVYRINVVGPWQMVRAVVPHMKAGGKGAIVNISSGAGIRGTGSSVAYATSKAGLNMHDLVARAQPRPGDSRERGVSGDGDRALASGAPRRREIRSADDQFREFDAAQAAGRSGGHCVRGVLADRGRRRSNRPGDHGRLRRLARRARSQEMIVTDRDHR